MNNIVEMELTNAQQNILEVEKSLLTDDNTSNILVVSIKFKSNLNFDKLDKTINKIIELNDSFRIKLLKKNNITKQYIDAYKYEKIETIEILNDNDMEDFINKFRSQPIDIHSKLYEFKLVSFNNHSYIFYKVHHIINDAWGITQVAEQIKKYYTIIDKENELRDIPCYSYSNAIENENKYYQTNRFERDQEFWQEYVKILSTERIFNKDVTETRATRIIKELDKNIREKITKYCVNHKISEYTFFLAIISIYYFKMYNVKSLNIGTPFLNRNKKELELIGLFVTNLPLNINVNQNKTFLEICEEINNNNYRIFKHSKYPYKEIQRMFSEINSASNLYEVGVSYQVNSLQNELNGERGETTWHFSNGQSNPITIHITNVNKRFELFYDYLDSIFDKDTIEEMHNIILHIIEEILSGKDLIVKNIDVISNNEMQKLERFNNTGKIKKSNITISEMLDNICKKYSKNIAIKFENEEMTYLEFYNKVCNLANILRNNGVKRNEPVALIFDKGFEMIISIFAVIKAGGYYIPILPQENKQRMEYILSDCNPICILTSKEYENIVEKNNLVIVDKDEIENKPIKIKSINSDNDIIYVIYTSGSTGVPKGVKLMHKNVVGLLNSIAEDEVLKATSFDISMSLLKYSFDASGIDIYTSIFNGGKLLLISKENELNPHKVVEIMQNEKVTRSFLVPKWLEHINNSAVEKNFDLSNLKILGTGGEAFKPNVVKDLFDKYKNLKILNLYGPTEATMFATYSIVNQKNIENNMASIGKPIKFSRCLVMNEHGDILPTNTKGELVLASDKTSIQNIANGYLNMPELTESRFSILNNNMQENKFTSMYRTGDIVKINNNLELEYYGRKDDVVKINNGYLVSINEVESKISQILDSKYSFTVVDINFNTSKALVIFICTNEEINLKSLKNYINGKLSFYMRIKDIIQIKEFPHNNSGKIDKNKLKELAQISIINKKIILPRTSQEEKIYEIVKEQCNVERFSITDDFIDDLGIDSLNMTVIHSLLNNSQIKMQDLYTYTTVEELAKFIKEKGQAIKGDEIGNVEIKNNTKKFELKNVLLTGATGFLGIHLLMELLKNENVEKIYCIVRSKGNISSEERLYKKIDYYFKLNKSEKEKIKNKVDIIDGDIANEELGMSHVQYKELSKKITTVFNCAANVRHYGKYEMFYRDNVTSIENILEFCKDKISLAHVSTLSIAGFKDEKTYDKVYDEDTLYINQGFNDNPYLITKFLAEKSILKSNTNAKIFRIGNIMPRISDGKFQENYKNNAFLNAIRLVLKLNKIPKDYLDFKVELSPVEECAKSIMIIANTESNNQIYHIVNNNEITIGEILNNIEQKVEIVSKSEFLHVLEKYEEIGSEYIKEYILRNNLNNYSIEKTIKLLNEKNYTWSKIDKRYIDNLIKIIEDNRW